MKKFFEYNPATCFAGVVAVALAACFWGCQPKPKVDNPWSPGQKITESAFRAEVVKRKAGIESRLIDIQAEGRVLRELDELATAEFERQQSMINEIMEAVGELVISAAGPYAGLAATTIALLTGGLSCDNRRKDGVIRGQKQSIKSAFAGVDNAKAA